MTTASLIGVVAQERVAGLVEAVVLVRQGHCHRVAAIALELDAGPGRWQVVELEY